MLNATVGINGLMEPPCWREVVRLSDTPDKPPIGFVVPSVPEVCGHASCAGFILYYFTYESYLYSS